jgi:cytochrome c oxidase subunit 4
MSGFNDPYPSYEHLAHHSEEEGKQKRKKLWSVFWIMLGITILELVVGFKSGDWKLNKTILMFFFISLTIVKAGFIVLSFMHLGDETKAYKWVILGPYCVFILYLALMVDIGEGSYSLHHRAEMDKAYKEQKEKAESEHAGGAEQHEEAPAGENSGGAEHH